jgi:hypothetical protein
MAETDNITETQNPNTSISFMEGLNESLNRRMDFDKNVKTYQERLEPYTYAPPRMDIFDLATELGAGILSTPNTGRASLYTGLGVGFTNASKKMQANRAEKEKARREIGLEAARLAMQDEQKANEFLDSIYLQLMGDSNKEIKANTLSYIDPATNERVERTFDISDPLYKTILRDPEKYQAAEVSKPLVDMSGTGTQYDKLNDLLAGQIADRQTKWAEDADGAYAVKEKAQYARKVALDLGEENFGQLKLWTMGLKNVALGLGMDGLVSKTILEDQELINQIGTGFVMSLVGQTKGAISNKEMDLFARASPGLGSTYGGFMKMVDYLERIADRSIQLDLDWANESAQLQDDGKSLDQIRARQSQFRAEWLEKNPLFTEKELENDIYKYVDDDLNFVGDNAEENEKIYNTVSIRHSNVDSLQAEVPSGVAKDIDGVPDGAMYQRTIDGIDYYMDAQGKIYRATK